MPLDRPSAAPPSVVGPAWGRGSEDSYERLAAPIRPILSSIRSGSVGRELERRLPFDEIEKLKTIGFTALRLPREDGGAGASLPEFFTLLIELSQADSNITQALRAHFGFVEHVLSTANGERRATWLRRLAHGIVVGGAWSEIGEAAKVTSFSARVTRGVDGFRLNGTKFYTTGSLFADWIQVGATDAEGESVSATVERHAPGVEVVDDWDGMGQRLTASGTSHFVDVPVADAEIIAAPGPFPYSQAFYQLVHLATLAGIGRAAADDLATTVAGRRRTYSHAAATRPAEDPQVLQVVGRVRSAAYAAGAIVVQAARALQRAADAVGQEDAEQAAVSEADLEVWQAQSVVSDLILGATATIFDALGASSTFRLEGLDRYWRNARTIVSHNPRMYRDRIVGDFAVNGTPPPGQWRIGQPEPSA
jgi:alkylation response protein AidB-like acyl-CoA dehydrogenase